MITTRTTFVIGAGASKPYGLPTAQELLDKARDLSAKSLAFQLLIHSGTQVAAPPSGDWTPITIDELHGVLEDIRQHSAPSLDAFLETRQHRPVTMRVGRALIATLMGLEIHAARTHRVQADQDWLGYVVNKMRAGHSTASALVARSHLKFVTFNFDNVIESRIAKEIRSLYADTIAHLETSVESYAASLVTHVHGQLPTIPTVPVAVTNVFGDYPREWLDWPMQSASRINVVTDTIRGDVVEAARMAITEASVLCFLGFAYATENLSRLDFSSAAMRDAEMYGSAYGLKRGEQAWVQGRLPGIQLGSFSDGCLDVLRGEHVFRD